MDARIVFGFAAKRTPVHGFFAFNIIPREDMKLDCFFSFEYWFGSLFGEGFIFQGFFG